MKGEKKGKNKKKGKRNIGCLFEAHTGKGQKKLVGFLVFWVAWFV